ncbi:MAG: ATP-binding cassette domain-containing protein [Lachnospiraceae bacterium]|nr:ATP-binding cassette domain-containing protein [Lachnospiraceae bacterium]
MIQINSISFSFGGQILFQDFSLATNAKCACIAGNNGIGKSTLLKLAAGILEPSSGKIKISGDSIYVEQECAEIPQGVFSSFWGGDNEARKFYSMLGVSEEKISRWEELSGGEKKCVQIAAALAENPAALFLDEPSNHLDGKTKQKIIFALKNSSAQIILVCHDREFADALCEQTIFLFRESEAFSGGEDKICAKIYDSNLSRALELRDAEFSSLQNEWQDANQNAKKVKTAAEKWRQEAARSSGRVKKSAIGKGDHDAKRKIDMARLSGKDRTAGDTQARFETLLARTNERRDKIKRLLAKKSGFSFSKAGADFETSNRFGANNIPENILQFPKTILANGKCVESFCIRRGARIALVGKNGSGKTLLIKAILQEAKEKGRAENIFYLPQITDEKFCKSLCEKFNLLSDEEKGAVLSTLYRLNSNPDSLAERENIFDASPGEIRKIAIAMSLCQTPPYLYILDEPTNHLDLESVLALEDALKNLSAALVLVSHDEAFLKNVLLLHKDFFSIFL